MRLERIRPLSAAELFALTNLAFLAADVWIAHTVNRFAEPLEWAPIVFSILGSLVLALVVVPRLVWGERVDDGASKTVGIAVGLISLLVGVTGMTFHLASHFFVETTMRSLVYTAPFVAPLAYAGIGLLILLNRLVDAESLEWVRSVLLLALGGSLGNFILSLADHAQNGFFSRAEWIPVAASAVGVASLLIAFFLPLDRVVWRFTVAVQLLELVVGGAGFLLHLRANVARPDETLFDRFLYGAPIFAPLLFSNIALLALIALWGAVRRQKAEPEPKTQR